MKSDTYFEKGMKLLDELKEMVDKLSFENERAWKCEKCKPDKCFLDVGVNTPRFCPLDGGKVDTFTKVGN